MDILKGIGIAGFLFFLIKGLVWLVIFYLAYKGILDKERMLAVKNRVYDFVFPFRKEKGSKK